MALLFDSVTHPDADMGVEKASLLSWEHRPEKAIPHVVLGRKAEGGAWQVRGTAGWICSGKAMVRNSGFQPC